MNNRNGAMYAASLQLFENRGKIMSFNPIKARSNKYMTKEIARKSSLDVTK